MEVNDASATYVVPQALHQAAQQAHIRQQRSLFSLQQLGDTRLRSLLSAHSYRRMCSSQHGSRVHWIAAGKAASIVLYSILGGCRKLSSQAGPRSGFLQHLLESSCVRCREQCAVDKCGWHSWVVCVPAARIALQVAVCMLQCPQAAAYPVLLHGRYGPTGSRRPCCCAYYQQHSLHCG